MKDSDITSCHMEDVSFLQVHFALINYSDFYKREEGGGADLIGGPCILRFLK